MEKIIIKNFLIFDELEMPIKKFNILIGEQASGKSLLAKLVYFFKTLTTSISVALYKELSLQSAEKKVIEEFKSVFDLFETEHFINDFQIVYHYSEDTYISIKHSNALNVFFSKAYINIIDSSSDAFESANIHFQNAGPRYEYLKQYVFRDFFYNKLGGIISGINDNYIFVPANRTFFSILEANSFMLLTNDKVSIDKFIKDFGATLQYLKNNHNKENQILNSYFKKVVKGEYHKIDGKDYIVGENYKVPLSKASSGQQESFPLMLTLCSLFGEKLEYLFNFIFIEEPEAHLFPQTQNQVISLILYSMYKKVNHSFITTHSPYILSALNNSIYANELIKKEKLTVADYVEMSDGAYPLDYDDVSAYSLKDGKLIDIKDPEFKMIGGDILDSVSNEFGEVMDKLMELDD